MSSFLLNIPMTSLTAWVRFVVQNLTTRSQTEGVSHCCGSVRWEKRRWCERCIWSKELTGNSAQQRWKFLRYYLCEIFLWLWHLKFLHCVVLTHEDCCNTERIHYWYAPWPFTVLKCMAGNHQHELLCEGIFFSVSGLGITRWGFDLLDVGPDNRRTVECFHKQVVWNSRVFNPGNFQTTEELSHGR